MHCINMREEGVINIPLQDGRVERGCRLCDRYQSSNYYYFLEYSFINTSK